MPIATRRHPPVEDDPASHTMSCQPDLPNDWACNEATDCMGVTSTCQMHFCCDVGGCCKGCRVTGYTPTLGGGGSSDLEQGGPGCFGNPADPCYVQSIWGQMSVGSGRAQGAANTTDLGVLPNAGNLYGGPPNSQGDAGWDCLQGHHGVDCEFSCFDGMQNGAEGGVDCGPICGNVCP